MPEERDILRADYLRSLAVEYAKILMAQRIPYIYGGNDIFGLDCNGLPHEILQGVGIERRGYDATAEGMWIDYQDKEVSAPYAGCLVFFVDKNGHVGHVGFMINNSHMIHAGGGDSETKTIQDAIRDNAYVRMDKYDYRKGPYRFVDPFKG